MMNTPAIKKLRHELKRQRLDGLLITKEANLAYLSGFKGEGQILLTPAKAILLVDSRYSEQAKREAKACKIWPRQSFDPPEKSLLRLLRQLKLNRLGIEAEALSYQAYRRLSTAISPAKLIPTINTVETLRAIKTTREIEIIKKAAGIAVKSFAFARRIIKTHRTEQEVAAAVQYFMRQAGAEDSAFELIIASGKNSSMPHAPSSHKLIKNNEIVLIDLGCRFQGYNSDLTRTVFLGKMKAKFRQIYQIVSQAQQLAIKAVRAGEKISEIDKAARQYLTQNGLGANFGHALGHGIGREVHEYPSISAQNHDTLKAGMVLTIEPGVYLPGWGGIRIEDMVLVKENGSEILTR